MEKVDIIKLLKEEQEKENISKTDFENLEIEKQLNNYFDKHLHKKLVELNKNNVIVYLPTSKDKKDIEETNKTKHYVLSVIKRLIAYQDTNFDELNEEQEQAIALLEELFYFDDEFYADFLFNYFNNKRGNDNLNVIETNDIEHKEEIANHICDVLVMKTNNKKILHFYKNYVLPNFKEVYKQGYVDFDITMDDERTEKIKDNIISTLTSFIIEFVSLGNRLDIKDENEKAIFNFLFSDDKDIKEAIALHYIEQFIGIYESKDFQEYLNSNKEGSFDIEIRTDDEITKEIELQRKYDIIPDKVDEVMNCGIIPALKQLNQEKEIVFNPNSPDMKVQKISLNIMKFIAKMIISYAENYLDDIEGNQNKTIGIMRFLFLDNTEENIENKKSLCKGMINSFLHYYDKIDFENTDFDKLVIGAYSSKETTEEEARKKINEMLEDKEN